MNGSDEGLTGLQQLRAMIDAGGRAPIGEALEFDLIEVDDGRAVFRSRPTARLYNPIGSVHGGYAATLLDSACGCAVHSRLSAKHGYTTLEIKVAYHKAITKDTGAVTAIGTVLSIGRRVAFAQATLVSENGTLLATATSTLLVFEKVSPPR